MKNKREKKKISSSGKALLVFLCFVLTIFFIALRGFSHSSGEDSRINLMNWNPKMSVTENPKILKEENHCGKCTLLSSISGLKNTTRT